MAAAGRAALLLSRAPSSARAPRTPLRPGRRRTGISCAVGAPPVAAASSVEGGRGTRYRAVLVDVGGCLLETRESITDTYQRIAKEHGVQASREQIKAGFQAGFAGAQFEGGLRYVGDGRPFWRHVVAECVGSDDVRLFEALYSHYAGAGAWALAEGAETGLTRLREAGVLLCVCSNFDTRLRPLLQDLGVSQKFDAVVVSAEVGAEKPDAAIFHRAMEVLGLADASEVLMVGDDAVNDVGGAAAVGMDALLWGRDVASFDEVAAHVLS